MLGGVLLTKGLSKASSVSKVGEVVDVSRIDYLRGKYGKPSSAELNERINFRGIRAEALTGISKTKHIEDYGKYSTTIDSKVTEIKKIDLEKEVGDTFTD